MLHTDRAMAETCALRSHSSRPPCQLHILTHASATHGSWHIPGGVGAEENTANTRVLVTRLDGQQTVECIENDLGLDLSDYAAVLGALKSQAQPALTSRCVPPL